MPEYDPPLNAFYTEVPVAAGVNPGKFIGRGGFHLKRITELSGVDYIWLDFRRLVVEVWSVQRRLIPKALRMLKRRMDSMKVEKQVTSVAPKDVEVECTLQYPRTIRYTITGEESACLTAFKAILKEYPHNPYFTKMKSMDTNQDGVTVIVVERSNTSD